MVREADSDEALGMAILKEMEDMGAEVLPMEPENPAEIASLKWRGR